MDRVRFEATNPAELFSVLRRLVRAFNDSNVWEVKALYVVDSFLNGAAATGFNEILPDAVGHIPVRTVAYSRRRCTGCWSVTRTPSP